MSLVDYGSSSDEDDDDKAGVGEEEEGPKPNDSAPPAPSLPPPDLLNQSLASAHQQYDSASPSSPPSIELPDASMLLASSAFSSHQTSGSDHSSRVAAAMAERASQKRESNGSALQYQRSKHPRGNLPHSRNLPDAGGGLLIPPQLRGRSNVVTEDISKLFVNRRTEPSH